MEPKKVLLIDDEVNFTRLVKLNLEHTGRYLVRIENHGTLGAAAAKEFLPDIIFLDIIMPDMDGSDVAIQLAEADATRNIPVVFLTAMVKKEEAHGPGNKIAGRVFLAKPVKLQELIDCIEKNARK